MSHHSLVTSSVLISWWIEIFNSFWFKFSFQSISLHRLVHCALMTWFQPTSSERDFKCVFVHLLTCQQPPQCLLSNQQGSGCWSHDRQLSDWWTTRTYLFWFPSSLQWTFRAVVQPVALTHLFVFCFRRPWPQSLRCPRWNESTVDSEEKRQWDRWRVGRRMRVEVTLTGLTVDALIHEGWSCDVHGCRNTGRRPGPETHGCLLCFLFIVCLYLCLTLFTNILKVYMCVCVCV